MLNLRLCPATQLRERPPPGGLSLKEDLTALQHLLHAFFWALLRLLFTSSFAGIILLITRHYIDCCSMQHYSFRLHSRPSSHAR